MKRILFLLLLTVSVYGQNPSRFAKIQITGNSNSGTATKVNVQEANGEVNTQTINTGFNKNIGLGGSDIVGATTLLNQYSTTPIDWTATAFNSGQVVFYGGKQWMSKEATVAGDVPNSSSKWEEITFEALANKTVIVDAIPTGGSNNAVSSNGVFDALATKAPISSVHNPVTIGTANGLSLATQQLSLGLASSGVTGALSGTDWNTFNNKQNALTNPVTGTGTNNFLTKWSSTNTVNASGAWRETSNRLANASDNGSSDFQVTGQIDLKSKNTQGDGGQLGAELLTTGTGDASWTGTSFATGYTHSTGSVTTLTSTLAPVINNLYQVSYTVTGRTAGSFTIAFGGATTAGITSSSAVGHRASTTGTLVITPTSDFNGTIVLSIKQITAGTASFVFRDNGGTIRSELRILGFNNTANGASSLRNNTTGSSNTANGASSLQNNTTGFSNTASGVNALLNNTTGNNNTANGGNVLQNNTTGSNNTASGVNALLNNTTGNNNTANGINAGRFISNGATSLTVANNSTFLGANTKALADNSTNETVVGDNAIGDGNNTVSIGSTSVVSSRLRGRILQGGVVDNLIDSGQFSGSVLATGFKTASGTASQFLKANGSVDSNTYLTSASLPTVDQTIIDGSTNAVSGNAVFDGLATKAPSTGGTGYIQNQNASAQSANMWISGNSRLTSVKANGRFYSIGESNFDDLASTTGAIIMSYDSVNAISNITSRNYSTSTSLPLQFEASSYSFLNGAATFASSVSATSFNSTLGSNFATSSGNVLIGTTTDNGVDKLQVAGTISASPATTANQVVIKSQLDAVAGTSGSYTPTLTPTNAVSVVLKHATYQKIGNIVTVRISVYFTPTSTTLYSGIECTLPFNRATTLTNNMGSGVIADITAYKVAIVQSMTTTTTNLVGLTGTLNSVLMSVVFQYSILE